MAHIANYLNFHHLHYFWSTVKEGGVGKASLALNVTQPTISKQLRLLEEQLGEPLFDRASGRMVLTDAGRLAFEYADEIFSLGSEFLENMSGLGAGRPRWVRAGMSDVLPKLICHKILAPVLEDPDETRLICEAGVSEELLAELSIQRLDLVLTDAPISGAAKVKAFNHVLGESAVSFFATTGVAAKLSGKFPKCLKNAPFLAPTDNTLLRRTLERWFNGLGFRPRIIAEFHDSALMKVFGREGAGVFVGPAVIEQEICREFGAVSIGRTADVRETVYASTGERKVKHPVVAKITEHARQRLFGGGPDFGAAATS